jgi:peptide/nickel transport system substrate-binding protein
MVGLVAALTSCTAGPQAPAPILPTAGPGGTKSIAIALPTDPIALAGSLSGGGKAVVPSRYFREFPNAYLTTYNSQDDIVPWLAPAVPSLDDGTWKVLEDGRMQVTWKLRPDITWHDGADLTSADLRFSWEIGKDLTTGVASQSIAHYVDDVATPDRQTAIFTWAAASPLGALAGVREFDVLPRHVLGDAERAGLSDTAYFTDPAQFIGSGPYRPLSWVVGNSLTLEAFGGYFLGRPRIDRITFRIIPDAGAALAHVLSGEVDVAYWAINYEGARVVQNAWKSPGGVVEMQANNARFLLPQMRADYVRPRDLLDVRVRRALLHAMDRTELAETAASGAARVTNSTTFPESALGRIVEARANRYDFDPARAAALFAEAGWHKGGDGVLTKAGARFELAYRVGAGLTDSNLILPVLQQQYRRSGIDLTFSLSTMDSTEASVTFTGLSARGLPVNQTGFLALFNSARIATAQHRWTGSNVHGYATPEVDDLLSRVDLTLRTEDRVAVWAEANRILLDDVAFMPLYNYPYPYVVRKGVRGALPANPINPPSYFVHTWDLD